MRSVIKKQVDAEVAKIRSEAPSTEAGLKAQKEFEKAKKAAYKKASENAKKSRAESGGD